MFCRRWNEKVVVGDNTKHRISKVIHEWDICRPPRPTSAAIAARILCFN